MSLSIIVVIITIKPLTERVVGVHKWMHKRMIQPPLLAIGSYLEADLYYIHVLDSREYNVVTCLVLHID